VGKKREGEKMFLRGGTRKVYLTPTGGRKYTLMGLPLMGGKGGVFARLGAGGVNTQVLKEPRKGQARIWKREEKVPACRCTWTELVGISSRSNGKKREESSMHVVSGTR